MYINTIIFTTLTIQHFFKPSKKLKVSFTTALIDDCKSLLSDTPEFLYCSVMQLSVATQQTLLTSLIPECMQEGKNKHSEHKCECETLRSGCRERAKKEKKYVERL